MNWRLVGETLAAAPVPESQKWGVALLAAAWFGTDEQVAYAQMRYEQERRKEDAMLGDEG